MSTSLLPAAHLTAPAARRPLAAANDDAQDPAAVALGRAALRLVANEGHGAADLAQSQATHAFFASDRAGTRWWLAVGRAIDRMLAAEAARPDRSPAAGKAFTA